MVENRSLESNFGASIPQTSADIETALKAGLLSLDANTLLNFYRYSPKAREALMDVLQAAGDRVWVSHQAALEFWRNRCSVIDSRAQATTDLVSAINKNESAIENGVNAWAKQTAIPEDVKTQLLGTFRNVFAEAREIINAEAAGGDVISYDADRDAVLGALSRLLSSHVGEPLPPDDHEAALVEGERRAKAGEPPGFRDIDKSEGGGPEGASGDYLVWTQSIREAMTRGLPLVVVTGDEKEDWWWRHRSAFLGPRAELAREFATYSQHRLYMLRPVDLTEHAGALNVTLPEDASDDVARASGMKRERWTSDAVFALLARLDLEGAVQAQVIREASANGGSIDRARIYELGGYSEDRMLRGFTKPTARITLALQEAGLAPWGVAPALEPRYETGVLALRFEVPREFVEILDNDVDEFA